MINVHFIGVPDEPQGGVKVLSAGPPDFLHFLARKGVPCPEPGQISCSIDSGNLAPPRGVLERRVLLYFTGLHWGVIEFPDTTDEVHIDYTGRVHRKPIRIAHYDKDRKFLVEAPVGGELRLTSYVHSPEWYNREDWLRLTSCDRPEVESFAERQLRFAYESLRAARGQIRWNPKLVRLSPRFEDQHLLTIQGHGTLVTIGRPYYQASERGTRFKGPLALGLIPNAKPPVRGTPYRIGAFDHPKGAPFANSLMVMEALPRFAFTRHGLHVDPRSFEWEQCSETLDSPRSVYIPKRGQSRPTRKLQDFEIAATFDRPFPEVPDELWLGECPAGYYGSGIIQKGSLWAVGMHEIR